MLYRRFTYLQSRLLLYKQDELRELETDLDDMDKRDSVHNARILKSREFDDMVGERKELFSTMEKKLNEYGN